MIRNIHAIGYMIILVCPATEIDATLRAAGPAVAGELHFIFKLFYMKNETNSQKGKTPDSKNVRSDDKQKGGLKNGDKNPGPDPTYNALHQKNDRTAKGRHAGESQMSDENRSGGSGL
jgi:hypothetical protein